MALVKENFRTLYCDPGEDFGWCVGVGMHLISRGIEKMWDTADEIGNDVEGQVSIFNQPDPFGLDGADPALFKLPIQRIVCEDFRIYPWKLKALKFDPVRTARVIGAITYICRRSSIDLVLQPAAIKSAAKSCGAEELFDYPLHENRHSNDAIMHFSFFTNTALLGRHIKVPNEGVEKP